MPVVVEVSPLEIARRARGLSQRDLADLAGVSRETVSLVERGMRPTRRTAGRISRALGVSVDALAPVKDEAPAGGPGLRDNFGRGGDRYESAA